jgi:hypothetical protein
LTRATKAFAIFFLMSSSNFVRRLRFTENVHKRYGLRRVGTFNGVIRAIKRRLA